MRLGLRRGGLAEPDRRQKKVCSPRSHGRSLCWRQDADPRSFESPAVLRWHTIDVAGRFRFVVFHDQSRVFRHTLRHSYTLRRSWRLVRALPHARGAYGAQIRLTHDRFDFGRCVLELPSGTLELISHSLAQRRDARLKALHLSQHFIDRVEGFFQPVLRRHITALRHQRQCSEDLSERRPRQIGIVRHTLLTTNRACR